MPCVHWQLVFLMKFWNKLQTALLSKMLTKASSILCTRTCPSDIQSNTKWDCEDDRDSVCYPLYWLVTSVIMLISFLSLLSSETTKPFLVNLGNVCHQDRSQMQAAATLLALTDPRGDKYICLLTHASKAVGKEVTDRTAKQIKFRFNTKSQYKLSDHQNPYQQWSPSVAPRPHCQLRRSLKVTGNFHPFAYISICFASQYFRTSVSWILT